MWSIRAQIIYMKDCAPECARQRAGNDRNGNGQHLEGFSESSKMVKIEDEQVRRMHCRIS